MRFQLLTALSLASATAFAADVSFTKDVRPILAKNCMGCHRAEKAKGKLDLTTYEAFKKGGKEGPGFVPGDKDSITLKQIRGPEPKMPEDGDALKAADVAIIEQWVLQGAKDDTPASTAPKVPPTYSIAPAVSSMAMSPDGSLLAVAGYHEVLLHKTDGSGLAGRLLGEASRIESIAFSADGKLLAIAGGSPGQFGQAQVWDIATKAQLHSFKASGDSLYGVSFSPDATSIAFGGADKSVRIISLKDGKETMKFDNHSDWVFATTFTLDGKRLLSGSRDKAMKLIDASNGQFIDDVNKLLDPVLCMARDPKQDQALYGGQLGGLRIYRISDNQKRTAGNIDDNMIRQFDRLNGPVRAVCFSPDGQLVAAGGIADEIRIYAAKDGKRVATPKGFSGPIFSLTFSPDGKKLYAAGHDGLIHIYETEKGTEVTSFPSVPISPTAPKTAAN